MLRFVPAKRCSPPELEAVYNDFITVVPDGGFRSSGTCVPLRQACIFPTMSWAVVLIVILVVCVIAMPFVGLYLRRRWLTGQGGLFDCAYRLRDDVPNSGWVLGLARLREDRLEWFHAFALGLRPAVSLQRGVTAYVEQRPASGLEQVVLFENSSVIRVKDRSTSREHCLAMDGDTTMGVITWLESAPPGSHYIPTSADSPL